MLKKPVQFARLREEPSRPTSPKRFVGELLKEDRWGNWPFGFKVLGAIRGEMALTSGYLFALRLARIHHARSSISSDEDPVIADDFGTDLGMCLLEKFADDQAKRTPPWRTETFLKTFGEALKDLATINGADSMPTELGSARILKKYHELRSGCLLPPMEKQIRNPATRGDGAYIHRSLKKFQLQLLDGHSVISLCRALRELTRSGTLSPTSKRATVEKFISFPLDWLLADLVEAILWCSTPDDILQPTILNFRQVSKRICEHFDFANAGERRAIEGIFRTLYFTAFDFSLPQVEFSDVCGLIPVPRRREPPMSYREMKTAGGLSEFRQSFLQAFEKRIEACFFDEIRAILDGGGQRRKPHQTTAGIKVSRKDGVISKPKPPKRSSS